MGLPSAPQGWDDRGGGHPRGVQGLAKGSPRGTPVWPRFPTPQRGDPRPGGGTPGAGSDPLTGMFVIWASVSLPVGWSDEPAGSLPEGTSGSAWERVSHVSEVVRDRGPLSGLRAQLPSGPTGLVRARPSGPWSPVAAPLLGSQAWDIRGLCAHRAQHSAVHPGELLPLCPPGLHGPPPSILCSPLSALASCLSESPSSPGQGPVTWHRTQGFLGGEQDGRPGGRREPRVSEGEGCCSGGLYVPAEGCSAPTRVPMLMPTPQEALLPSAPQPWESSSWALFWGA